MAKNSEKEGFGGDELKLMGFVALLAGSVFIFFKTFFENKPDDLTIEILAALLGSILTVMITMLLMKRQGSIEEAKEAATTNKTKIFEKKLELFRQFIETYVGFAADGRLDQKELQQLEELALVISLFTKSVPSDHGTKDFGEELCRFILQLQICGLSEDLDPKQTRRFKRHMESPDHADLGEMLSFVDILRLMKFELGIAQSAGQSLDQFEELSGSYHWAGKLLDYRDYREEA